jgi:hypothetical protein
VGEDLLDDRRIVMDFQGIARSLRLLRIPFGFGLKLRCFLIDHDGLA